MWSCNSNVTVCFSHHCQVSIFSSQRLLTYRKHSLLVASSSTQVLLRLPLLASFPRLSLSVAQQMRTRSHTQTLSHSQQCMYTRSSRNDEPDWGVLQVNRCMLLVYLACENDACFAFCFLLIAFVVVVLSNGVRLFVLFLFFFSSVLIIALLRVWRVGIFLFSRKERVAPSVAKMCVSSSS